jgi:hypothetical protein
MIKKFFLECSIFSEIASQAKLPDTRACHSEFIHIQYKISVIIIGMYFIEESNFIGGQKYFIEGANFQYQS